MLLESTAAKVDSSRSLVKGNKFIEWRGRECERKEQSGFLFMTMIPNRIYFKKSIIPLLINHSTFIKMGNCHQAFCYILLVQCHNYSIFMIN